MDLHVPSFLAGCASAVAACLLIILLEKMFLR